MKGAADGFHVSLRILSPFPRDVHTGQWLANITGFLGFGAVTFRLVRNSGMEGSTYMILQVNGGRCRVNRHVTMRSIEIGRCHWKRPSNVQHMR
jgi:hypothetical protein